MSILMVILMRSEFGTSSNLALDSPDPTNAHISTFERTFNRNPLLPEYGIRFNIVAFFKTSAFIQVETVNSSVISKLSLFVPVAKSSVPSKFRELVTSKSWASAETSPVVLLIFPILSIAAIR